MKRIFDMQKNVHEVTITLDYEDYLELMSQIKVATIIDIKDANPAITRLNEIREEIEKSDVEYIWDEI